MADLAVSPMLEVAGLRCGYGRAEILHGIDLRVGRGEIACLIGANGAGKTTLIRAILGLIPAWSGAVRLDAHDVTALSTPARVERGLAVVLEGRGVLARLSVAENLMMGGYTRRGAPDLHADLDRIYALFPVLAERRQQMAGTLSGGEQQMLVMGRALMTRPKLLALDEPSFGLAPKIVRSIFEVIVGLRAAGLTILLVEQNAHIALEVSQHGYVLDDGNCIIAAEAAELRRDSRVRDIYLGAG